MAHEASDLAKANGWAKDMFGEVQDLRPESGFTLTRRVKFDSKHKLGEKLSEVVWLTDEAGFSYSSDANGAVIDLNDAVAAESKEATVTGVEITLVSHTAYKTLSASVGDKAAFGRYWPRKLANMRKSFNKRVEIAAKYGGSPLGTLTSATDGGTSSVFTITEATWAPGFWSGAKNTRIDAYNGSTLLNDEGELKITKVDIKNRQITVSGDADDIDAIFAVGTNGSGVDVYFKGAKGNDGTGVRTVANHSSGELYNISADTYADFWAATQHDANGAPLSWSLIADVLAEMAGRGCEVPLILEVSQKGWSQLATDINALRVIDASYKPSMTEIGVEGIKFRFHTGSVEVVPSNYQWQGDAIFYPDPKESDNRRVGSTDVTFMNPDKGGEMFSQVPGKNAVEVRAFSDQQYYTTQVRDHGLIFNLG